MKIITIKKSWIVNFIILFVLIVLLITFNNTKVLHTINQSVYNPVYKGTTNEKQVAFECNVVWGTEYIDSLLEILKDRNIQITFNIGGKWAEDNKEKLKEIVSYGHELGNHGYSHKHHSKLTYDNSINEIYKAQCVIEEITGITTSIFAPPYGEFDKNTLRAAQSLNYTTIMWSIDTIDWRGDGETAIKERVLSNLHNDAFILIHPTQDTVNVLPEILNELNNRGYGIVRITELIQK